MIGGSELLLIYLSFLIAGNGGDEATIRFSSSQTVQRGDCLSSCQLGKSVISLFVPKTTSPLGEETRIPHIACAGYGGYC